VETILFRTEINRRKLVGKTNIARSVIAYELDASSLPKHL
jgi:hypothetical protein